MKIKYLRVFIFLSVFVMFFSNLFAEDKRTLPLDVYLIIDGSESMKDIKDDVSEWLNTQLVDRILIDGDKINIWTSGDSSQLIYSGNISLSSENSEIKDKIANFDITGKKPDFLSSLQASSRMSAQTPQSRLAYTMLITSSAGGLEESFRGNSQGLFRWFRSEKYERWQVLVVDPNLGPKVQQNARAYMNSIR